MTLGLNNKTLNERGVSLVQIIISLAITILLMLGVYKLYINQMKVSECDALLIEAQQNVRGTMELMHTEIMQAGHIVPREVEVITIAAEEAIAFRFLNAKDKRIMVSYYRDNETVQRLECFQDAGWNGCLNESGTVAALPQTMIENLNTSMAYPLRFRYGKKDGTDFVMPIAAIDLKNIRYIKIELNVLTAKKCLSEKPPRRKPVASTIEVRARNLHPLRR